MIIKMLKHMDDDTLNRLKQRDFIEEKENYQEVSKSKFIISPENKWNMMRNNYS